MTDSKDTAGQEAAAPQGRITWKIGSYSSCYGHVAGISASAYAIHWDSSVFPGGWKLRGSLPGQEDLNERDDSMDALKAIAEERFEEFVHGLGAIFPDETPEPETTSFFETREKAWGFDTRQGFIPAEDLVGRTVNIGTKDGLVLDSATVTSFIASEGVLVLHGGQSAHPFLGDEPRPHTVTRLPVHEIARGYVHGKAGA